MHVGSLYQCTVVPHRGTRITTEMAMGSNYYNNNNNRGSTTVHVKMIETGTMMISPTQFVGRPTTGSTVHRTTNTETEVSPLLRLLRLRFLPRLTGTPTHHQASHSAITRSDRLTDDVVLLEVEVGVCPVGTVEAVGRTPHGAVP